MRITLYQGVDEVTFTIDSEDSTPTEVVQAYKEVIKELNKEDKEE